jgi:hypothetical protein
MAKYLAMFTDTINDIEVNGFIVMGEKDVESYEEIATSISWPFVFEIGEYEIEFTNGEDLLTRIEFKELSSEEVKAIKHLFNNKYGIFIDEEFLLDIIGDEEDEDDLYDDEDDYDNEELDVNY